MWLRGVVLYGRGGKLLFSAPAISILFSLLELGCCWFSQNGVSALAQRGNKSTQPLEKEEKTTRDFLIDECRQSPTLAHSERVLCMHVLADALFFQLKIDGFST